MPAGSFWFDVAAGRLVGVQLDRLAGRLAGARVTHRRASGPGCSPRPSPRAAAPALRPARPRPGAPSSPPRGPGSPGSRDRAERRFSSTTGSAGSERQPLAHRQQRGDAGGGVLGVELRDDLIGQPPDLGAAGHAGPGGIDAVDNVLGRRLAAQERERLGPRAAAPPPPPPKLPKPWIWCIDRLRPAMAPSGSPVTGSLPPISIRTDPAPPPPPPPRPNPPPFWRIRFGCQGVSSPSCSGNAFGSPASLNASTASIADAVWWPWPPPWGENRVITTSGRNVRITRTMSDTTPAAGPRCASVSRGSWRSRSRSRG